MVERATPTRLPQSLFAVAGYFLPRLLFLPSRHAGQISWGDIAVALQDFPESELDLASAEFWEIWMARWAALGEQYVRAAEESASGEGRRRLNRAATACFHWAEFMYFSDGEAKLALRRRVKMCFRRSIDPQALRMIEGVMKWRGVAIPYYLLLPADPPATGENWPCMVMSNGLDSVTEVEMIALAEPFLARGIAVFLFDGPGQGINLGRHPMPLDPEAIVDPIVALLEARPQIDPARLGFLGISFGGAIALRVAAAHGHRFRCVVNLSGGPELCAFDLLPRRLKADFQYAFMRGDPAEMRHAFDALALVPTDPPATEVLSVHGALDDIFPVAPVLALGERWGARHQLRAYETEAHACLNHIVRYTVEAADWASLRLSRSPPRARSLTP